MKNALAAPDLLARLQAAIAAHQAGGTMAEAFQAAFPDRQVIDPRQPQQTSEARDDDE